MANSPDNPKRIGNIDGAWAVMLKIMLASYPPLFAGLLAWGSWVSKELWITSEFRNRGDRFTATEAVTMRREIDKEMAVHLIESAKIQAMLEDIRSRLAQIETKLDEQ